MILKLSEKALGNNKSNLPTFSTHLSSSLKRLKANTKYLNNKPIREAQFLISFKLCANTFVYTESDDVEGTFTPILYQAPFDSNKKYSDLSFAVDYICQVSQTVIDRFAFYSALRVSLLRLAVRAMKCRFFKKE